MIISKLFLFLSRHKIYIFFLLVSLAKAIIKAINPAMNCRHCRYPQNCRSELHTQKADTERFLPPLFCDGCKKQSEEERFSVSLCLIRWHVVHHPNTLRGYRNVFSCNSPASCAMTLIWFHLTAQSKSTLAGLLLWIYQNDNADIERKQN